MKRFAVLGFAAAMLLAAQVPSQPAQAKSLGSMINSAVNSLDGRSAYYNQFRYANPYYGYGYGYGYGNPYYGYNSYYGAPRWTGHRRWRGWY